MLSANAFVDCVMVVIGCVGAGFTLYGLQAFWSEWRAAMMTSAAQQQSALQKAHGEVFQTVHQDVGRVFDERFRLKSPGHAAG